MTCELKTGKNSKAPSECRKCRFWHGQHSQTWYSLPGRTASVGSETVYHHIQMPYDRSTVSSKPSSSECAKWARASSCKFQYLFVSLTHPVCAYLCFLVLPSFLSFLQQRHIEGSSYARCVQSWHSSYVWYSSLPCLCVTCFHSSEIGPTDLLHPFFYLHKWGLILSAVRHLFSFPAGISLRVVLDVIDILHLVCCPRPIKALILTLESK